MIKMSHKWVIFSQRKVKGFDYVVWRKNLQCLDVCRKDEKCMMGMGFQLSHHLTTTKSQKSTEEDSESYVINNRVLQPNIAVNYQ